MKLLDRLLIRTYFKAYAVCFFTLVSLYIVIDLFSNLDEFMEVSSDFGGLLEVMGVYYLYRLVLIFDRLHGVIVLLAAVFTVAWLQRNNELVPLLSAGIPTRRVLWPVFLGTTVMLAAGVANRELLIPRIADHLENPVTATGEGNYQKVYGAYDSNDILITGMVANPEGRVVLGFTCTIPEKLGGLYHITAQRAHYIPKGRFHRSGGWLLLQTTPADLKPKLPVAGKEPILEKIETGKFFLRTDRVDFNTVTRNRTWYQFASTWDILKEIRKPESARLAAMAVQLHLRLTLPILMLILVLLGLSTVLRDQGRNVFIKAGLCLLLAGVFYAAAYLSRYLGEYEYFSPPLAAWFPVLIFGPFALVLFDTIQT